MKNEKAMMIVASVFSFLTAIIAILLGVLVLFFDETAGLVPLAYGAVAAGIGVFSIVFSRSEEKMVNNRGWVLAFAIVSLLQSIVSAILFFIAYDHIGKYMKNMNAQPNAPNNNNITGKQNEKKKFEEKPVVIKEQISPEKKKIDILAKLGVFLVVLAGFILSTSYNNLFSSDISKPITMALLFLLFRALYRLFSDKIKIESSSKLYYILSYVFFVLIFVSIGYFGVLSYDLSFEGVYGKLMLAVVLLSLSYSLVCIRDKYDVKYLGEISFSLVLASIILVLYQYEFELLQVIGVLLILSLFIFMNRYKLNKCILNVNNILFVVLVGIFTLDYISGSDLDVLEILIGIFIVALMRQRVVTNDEFASTCRYVIPIFINILTVFTIYKASSYCDLNSTSAMFIQPHVFNYRMITIVLLLLTGVLFLRGKDKETVNSGLYSSVILSLCETVLMINEEYSMIAVLASMIIFAYITFVLKLAQKDYIRRFCFTIQFISLLFLSISGVLFYINNGIDVTYDTMLTVFIIFTIILHRFEKNIFNEYQLNKIMYYGTIIGLLITSSLFISNHNIAYNAIMLALLFVYRRFTNVEERNKSTFNYLFLLCVFINVSYILAMFTSTITANAILLVALLISAYYFSKEKYLPFLTICLAYLPYALIINELVINNVLLDDNILIILTRLPLMALVFVISRKIFTMTQKEAFIFETILLSIIFLSYIFNVDLTLGLFTFVLALIMIYIGFRNNKLNSLFVVGIGATILNIIVQLSDFWASVPLPVYLLLSGLAIIGYVTYKEINKNKEEPKDKPEKKKFEKFNYEKEEVDKSDNSINIILLVITVVCIGLNVYNVDQAEENRRIKDIEIGLINRGINTDDVYINEDDNEIFIVRGKHYNITSILNEYGNHESNPYYLVTYVSEAELYKIKKNPDKARHEYCYDDGSCNSFTYTGSINRNYSVNGVSFEVKNSIINYLVKQNQYYYYNYYSTNKKNELGLIYNINDVDELELYFYDFNNKVVTITTSSGSVVVNKAGLYKVKDKEGKVTIKVVNKEVTPDIPVEYYDYSNYNKIYD